MKNYSHAEHIQYVILVHPAPFKKKKKTKCHRNVASVSAVMFSTAARISAFGFFTCRGDHLFDNKFSAVIWYTATNASVSVQL